MQDSVASSSATPPHGAEPTNRSNGGGNEQDDTEAHPYNVQSEESPYGEEQSTDTQFDAIERSARAALEAIAVKDADVEFHMSEYVAVLKDYRNACQQRAMYKEAQLVQHVLRNLRLEEETRHVRGLTEQQMMERHSLEEANREEFRTFHLSWNEKIDEFEESQLELELQLLERQNEELIRFHDEMHSRMPIHHYSRSLIDMRNRQQMLANQREYVAAAQAKRLGDTIELADIGKQEEATMLLYARREHTLRHHHQQELNALRTKVESRRLFLERNRKRELDELLQRYINIRRGLETHQNIVRNKTGTYLLKHALNTKSDMSGTSAVVASAYSGAFGSVIKQRHEEELRNAKAAQTLTITSRAPSNTSGRATTPLALADGAEYGRNGSDDAAVLDRSSPHDSGSDPARGTNTCVHESSPNGLPAPRTPKDRR